ncbi:MAG: 4'-phosphopantetheinyl transferase family protein [Spirochaetia bacterium]
MDFGDFSAEAGASGILTREEVRRTESFPIPIEGARYAASRLFLRSVLAEYAGLPAGELEFCRGSRGKPVLSNGPSGLHFNLSHSGNSAALAVSDTEVGLDIERHRRIRDLDFLVEYAFAPEEAAVFRELPGGAREEIFFRAWCLKEAVIKTWGERAALYLDRVRVISADSGAAAAGGRPVEKIRFEDSFARKGVLYRARLLDLLPGYSSAVCIRRNELPEIRIRRYSWPRASRFSCTNRRFPG